MKIDEVIDMNVKFAKYVIKENGEIATQVAIGRGKEIIVIILENATREHIRKVLDKVNEMNPDWACFLAESYTQSTKNPKELAPGQLEKLFKAGDATVTESVIVQAYTHKEKRMIMLEKKGNTLIKKVDTPDFSGYLDMAKIGGSFDGKKM